MGNRWESPVHPVMGPCKGGLTPEIPDRHLSGKRVYQDLAESVRSSLLVQHYIQERSVDLKTAVILDETELAEFVHEEIDA